MSPLSSGARNKSSALCTRMAVRSSFITQTAAAGEESRRCREDMREYCLPAMRALGVTGAESNFAEADKYAGRKPPRHDSRNATLSQTVVRNHTLVAHRAGVGKAL